MNEISMKKFEKFAKQNMEEGYILFYILPSQSEFTVLGIEVSGVLPNVTSCTGATLYIYDGKLETIDCNCDECRSDFADMIRESNKIYVTRDKFDYTWYMDTDLPHIPFSIINKDNQDEKFCRGIILNVN